MIKKFGIISTLFSVILLILLFNSTNAIAYRLIGGYWANSYVSLLEASFSGNHSEVYTNGYYAAWRDAGNSWTDAPTAVHIDLDVGDDISTYVDYYGMTEWNAMTVNKNAQGQEWTGSYATSLITLNRSWMDSYPQQKKQAIIAHEFGHALGLGHNYDRGEAAMEPLMWFEGSGVYYDRWGTYFPTIDEINGINDLY